MSNTSSGFGSNFVDNALHCRILSSNNVPGDSQLRSLGGGGLRGGGGIVVVEALRDYLCWIWSPFWSGGPKNVFLDFRVGFAAANYIEGTNCNANS